jgi:hypothetical protein
MRTNTIDGVLKRDILEWHVSEEVLAVLPSLMTKGM